MSDAMRKARIARSRLRTDMIETIITMTVYIIDKDKSTNTAIATDLPEATRITTQGPTGKMSAGRLDRTCLHVVRAPRQGPGPGMCVCFGVIH